MVLDPECVIATDTDTMPRTEWLALRQQGLGGSDAAAVAGLDPWRTPLEVWHEKRSELPEGWDVRDEALEEKANWGHKLEPVLAAEFSARTGLDVIDANVLVKHPDLEFMLANPDRFVDDPSSVGGTAGLELKTTSIYLREEWDDGAPFRALLQSTHYMEVLGLKTWYIAVLIGGQEFRWVRIDHDADLAGSLLEIEADFWDRVQSGVPPAPVADDTRLLAMKWRGEQGRIAQVDRDEVMELLTQRRRLKLAIGDIETEVATIENQLKMMVGPAEAGCVGEWPLFTWKEHTRTDLDVKRFRAEMPTFAASYNVSGPQRRFNVPGRVKEQIDKAIKEGGDAQPT